MAAFYAPAPQGGVPRRIVDVLNAVQRGKLNCTGQVTLTAGGTTTTVVDPRIGPDSCILLSPLTANAAAVAWWISAQSNGSATITHPNSPAADQKFNFALIG